MRRFSLKRDTNTGHMVMAEDEDGRYVLYSVVEQRINDDDLLLQAWAEKYDRLVKEIQNMRNANAFLVEELRDKRERLTEAIKILCPNTIKLQK